MPPAPPTPTDVDDVAEDELVATDAPPPLELPAVALPPPPPEADPPCPALLASSPPALGSVQ
ncbi:hypothetical protein BE18_33320 [Sorangium cellulosum]|uniref:Uncharacterized protein n=1 Tax=Sorangium cellulosum TaxID=56 RepID=A0A150SRC4_SORCE|nr:hypothetical protein BE18_33320 [Sorangium cellulosum]